ncbi:unnamed protein product [Rhizoctonia solani]|uniref:Uncharacterized protein n=1 Tax=Rhizoctonia solani TaxID=456999 RepID=A0A8H3E7G6_9AGAM|nr:unnamed protein product [Rhizoctonia solani]
MSGKKHLHWGRIVDKYDSTYVYDPKTPRQYVELSPQATEAIQTDGAKAINMLRVLGESSLDPDWNDGTSRITLPLLESLLDYTMFPSSLPMLGNPMVIRGCIKLLKSITRSGKCSPFSYEYGHLCFRVLLISYDYCVLKISDRHDGWMTEAAQPENQLLKGGLAPMLSNTVSELIEGRVIVVDGDFYSGFALSRTWGDSHTGPLVEPEYVRLLTQVLDEDRNNFMIFMRSNYSLKLTAIVSVMFQVLQRTPPTRENLVFIQEFSRVYRRCLLFAPGDPSSWGWQHQFAMAVTGKLPLAKQKLDAEESKTLLRVYTDRLTVLSDSSLYPRATSLFAVEHLGYIVPLLGDGCEELIPPAIHATVGCMCQDMGDNPMADVPDEVLDACIRLFEHFKTLFELLAKRIQVTRGPILTAAMDAILKGKAGSLAPRLLFKLSPNRKGLFERGSPTLSLLNSFRGIASVIGQDPSTADLGLQIAASGFANSMARSGGFDPENLCKLMAAASLGIFNSE